MSTSVTPSPSDQPDRPDQPEHPDRARRPIQSGDLGEQLDTGSSTRKGRGRTRAARGQRALPWRRIFGGGAIAVLVLAVLWAIVYFTPLFAVKNVEVEGSEHLAPEDVISAAGVPEGTPLAQVDMRQTASNVVSLPWVKSATASRSWPSTVTLKVEENTAVAYLNASDGTHLIDPEGKEFAVDTPPEDAVELTGTVDSDDAVRKDAVEIAAALSETGRGAVKSIEAKSKYEFVLHLKDDRTIIWGASEDNGNKALAVDTVLQREGQEFNVTNPRQVTVK